MRSHCQAVDEEKTSKLNHFGETDLCILAHEDSTRNSLIIVLLGSTRRFLLHISTRLRWCTDCFNHPFQITNIKQAQRMKNNHFGRLRDVLNSLQREFGIFKPGMEILDSTALRE